MADLVKLDGQRRQRAVIYAEQRESVVTVQEGGVVAVALIGIAVAIHARIDDCNRGQR